MSKKNSLLNRTFLGEVCTTENKWRVSNFEKAHLKGYLRGQELFQFGINKISGKPSYYSVKFKLTDNEKSNNI